jgi:hypothetical protein
MTTPADPGSFDELRGSLPSHHEELLVAHEGRPTISTQDRRHGAGLPAADHGQGDTTKYGGTGR